MTESRGERRKRLRKASQEAAAKVDSLLDEELGALGRCTNATLEGLRPKIQDQASFSQLVEAVAESTRRNESLAQFRDRVERLGQGVRTVAKEVFAVLKK